LEEVVRLGDDAKNSDGGEVTAEHLALPSLEGTESGTRRNGEGNVQGTPLLRGPSIVVEMTPDPAHVDSNR